MKKQPQSANHEEFENFKKLTKNLLAVPKKEVDEKRAQYEREKSKKERPAK
jgi:hypothetical protein